MQTARAHHQPWHHFTPHLAAPRPRSRWLLRAVIVAAAGAILAGVFWLDREPAAQTLRTEIGEVHASGGISLQAAQSMIAGQRERIEACFAQASLQQKGTLEASVAFGLDGSARRIEVSPGKGNLAPIAPCVGRVLGALSTGGLREVRVDFTLTRK